MYDIDATSIVPARRGFYGETWHLFTASNSYFLKLDYSPHRMVYERSFTIVDHLCRHGINFVSCVVKTKDGALSARFDEAVLGVFSWIDGENIETEATKTPEYQMLAKVYTIPCQGLNAPVEDFSGKSALKFFYQWKNLSDEQLGEVFERHRADLEQRAARLEHFAELCRGDMASFFITHGDAGGNLIISGDMHFLVDWDDAILAPPERDAWNMLCHKEWAWDLFQTSLFQEGIDYIIRPERLAYYCYYYYFYYLTEFLESSKRFNVTQEVVSYFTDWAENRALYADTHF